MNTFTASEMIRSSSKVLEQFTRSLIAVSRALKHRREVINLAECDDRMLRDIGLTRDDVSSALSEPLYLNPSWVLVRCAGQQQTGMEQEVAPMRKTRPALSLVRAVA